MVPTSRRAAKTRTAATALTAARARLAKTPQRQTQVSAARASRDGQGSLQSTQRRPAKTRMAAMALTAARARLAKTPQHQTQVSAARASRDGQGSLQSTQRRPAFRMCSRATPAATLAMGRTLVTASHATLAPPSRTRIATASGDVSKTRGRWTWTALARGLRAHQRARRLPTGSGLRRRRRAGQVQRVLRLRRRVLLARATALSQRQPSAVQRGRWRDPCANGSL